MPILPFHRYCDDHRFLSYVKVIRRLGVTFILLLSTVALVFYAFTSVLTHSFPMSPMLTTIQSLSVSFVQYESGYGWDTIRPGEHCLRYSTREYTSRLLLLQGTHNSTAAMKACREIPVEIHGRLLKSNWCLDLGFGRGIYGFWVIAFDEPKCETRWGEFNDLGCSGDVAARVNAPVHQTTESEGTPLRRIESRLENLQPGSNWQIMCVTTPAEIHGRRYGSPGACFYDTKHGVFGIWDVEDLACY